MRIRAMMNADSFSFDRLCDRTAQPINLHPAAAGGKTFAGATECGQHWRSILAGACALTMLNTNLLICVHLSWLLSAYICDKIP